jgi:hypothetical protein
MFPGAYLVHQEALVPNDFHQNDYSVRPGAGIVGHRRRIRFATEGRDRANIAWELSSYLFRWERLDPQSNQLMER